MAELLGFLIIGCAAGWVAGKLFQGRGFGLGGNLIVGVIGSLIGGFLYVLLGAQIAGVWGQLVSAVLGSIVLLLLLGARPPGMDD